MPIQTFRSALIFRVLLLSATLILLAFLIFRIDFVFVPLALVLLVIYQVVSLVRFTEKTNRDLSRFLLSIRYDDTSQTFTSKGLGTSFSELKDAFNEVMEKLRATRSENEVRARYLKTIIQHVGIGLLSYKADGTIDLINNAAKKLLKTSGFKNIRNFEETCPDLVNTLLHLKHGEKKLVKLSREDDTGYLSIFAHSFVLREEEYVLVSLQNIQEELEEKEMEAWQNLIRVLTHEIMNSITPISSMSSTLLGMIEKDGEKDAKSQEGMESEELDDMADALTAIHRRSQGLMNFVSTYRNMTLIPKPKFRLLMVKELFGRVEKLMSHKMTDGNIAFEWTVSPETLELTADPDLMEQVMINLLLNAVSAVDGIKNPRITLSAMMSQEGGVVITVEDNGVGIEAEALEKMFIPFFTTKKQGSGIGLSLSRQILRLHHATIRAKSKPNEGAVFNIKFV
jgi:nitrogen fixation/metabolism regulation signal transduction histidine kinase